MPKKCYKTCVVPLCKNTTIRTPNKIFISIPRDQRMRKLWCKAMRRSPFVSIKTTHYCCEDHFNIKEDMENYIQYVLTKGNVKIRMKPGTIPHCFVCQNRKPTAILHERSAFTKRRRLEIIKEIFKENGICESSIAQQKVKRKKVIEENNTGEFFTIKQEVEMEDFIEQETTNNIGEFYIIQQEVKLEEQFIKQEVEEKVD